MKYQPVSNMTIRTLSPVETTLHLLVWIFRGKPVWVRTIRLEHNIWDKIWGGSTIFNQNGTFYLLLPAWMLGAGTNAHVWQWHSKRITIFCCAYIPCLTVIRPFSPMYSFPSFSLNMRATGLRMSHSLSLSLARGAWKKNSQNNGLSKTVEYWLEIGQTE